MTVEDEGAVAFMKRLANSRHGDPAVVAVESGGVCLAALLEAVSDPAARRIIGLGPDALCRAGIDRGVEDLDNGPARSRHVVNRMGQQYRKRLYANISNRNAAAGGCSLAEARPVTDDYQDISIPRRYKRFRERSKPDEEGDDQTQSALIDPLVRLSDEIDSYLRFEASTGQGDGSSHNTEPGNRTSFAPETC